MSNKVIKMMLTEKGIDQAIRQLDDYKQSLEQKTELLQRRLAERIKELSQQGFDNSLVDDILNGDPHIADVSVTLDPRGDVTVVVAKGADAIWVEFGAGVYHNTSVGSSPNPNGAKMGYTIGSFGRGRGKQKIWYFEDESGEVQRSRGTEATMPMYNAMRQVESEILRIAREVFE